MACLDSHIEVIQKSKDKIFSNDAMENYKRAESEISGNEKNTKWGSDYVR